MRPYYQQHAKWRPSKFTLEMPLHELIKANGTKRKLEAALWDVRSVLEQAMVTSKLNAIFEKQLRGMYGESNSEDINS